MFDLKNLVGIIKTNGNGEKLSFKKHVFPEYRKQYPKLDSEGQIRNFVRKTIMETYLQRLVNTKNVQEFKDFWEWHFNNDVNFAIIPNSKKKESYAELVKRAEKVYNSTETAETAETAETEKTKKKNGKNKK